MAARTDDEVRSEFGRLYDGGLTTLASAERVHLVRLLELTGWNMTQTARLLEVERSTVQRMVARFEIHRPGVGAS